MAMGDLAMEGSVTMIQAMKASADSRQALVTQCSVDRMKGLKIS